MNASSAAALMPPVIPPHPQSPHDGWMASFPRRSFLELGAYDTAPGSARGHARNLLAEWGLGAFEEKVSLVVTEIVTNSIVATGTVRWEAAVTEPPQITTEGNGMPASQCVCGFIEDQADDQTITDHLLEVFAPADDKGTDGLVHLEGERNLTCLCGLVSATVEELDAHFVAVFTPADGIGRDGKEHNPNR